MTEEQIARASAAPGDFCLSASYWRNEDRQCWDLNWLCEEAPDPEQWVRAIKETEPDAPVPKAEDIEIEELPDRDWLAYSYKGFQPFCIGPLFIYGSNYEGMPPEKSTSLQIDAASAFGSGEHGTTAGCLEAMLYLQTKGFIPVSVLDVGTGSGILAIAAYKLWNCSVLASDIDPEAVRVARHHCALNGCEDSISCLAADGVDGPDIATKGPYDLVLANILAEPLTGMAEELAGALVPGTGRLVLSGMLDKQAEKVLDVYQAQGLTPEKSISLDGWTTLVLR